MTDNKQDDLDIKNGVLPDIIVLEIFILGLKLMIEATETLKHILKKKGK